LRDRLHRRLADVGPGAGPVFSEHQGVEGQK
jgi:hypothetical protein